MKKAALLDAQIALAIWRSVRDGRARDLHLLRVFRQEVAAPDYTLFSDINRP